MKLESIEKLSEDLLYHSKQRKSIRRILIKRIRENLDLFAIPKYAKLYHKIRSGKYLEDLTDVNVVEYCKNITAANKKF
jgi:hypothetical protein